MPQIVPKLPTADQLLGCTCFRLRQLNRRVTQIYDQALAPLDITVTQFSLLALLTMRGETSIGELADAMLMDPTSLTRTLRPLERRKLIRIVTVRDDRRRRGVLLTEAGRAAFRDAVPLWREGGAKMADALGARSLVAFDQSLALALEHLAGD